MTTSANLDLVRTIHVPWERGDFSSAEWAHPEIEFVMDGGDVRTSFTRLTGLAEGFRDFLTWEDYRYIAKEYREIDDEHILLPGHAVGGRGKKSGIDAQRAGVRGANLYQIRDGKVIRLVMYFDSDRALADLGLTLEESRDTR